MAKGHNRSNREIKKPKAAKPPAAVPASTALPKGTPAIGSGSKKT